MKLSSKDRESIVNTIMQGDANYADLGRKYGVSREYVRQLAYQAGVTGREQRADRREDWLSEEAESLVEDREYYVPPRWSERRYTRAQFEWWLGINDPELLKRWDAAQKLPISNSGHATPDNQRCTECGVWKPWDKFYSDLSRIYGKSSRCQLCAKDQAREAYHLGRQS